MYHAFILIAMLLPLIGNSAVELCTINTTTAYAADNSEVINRGSKDDGKNHHSKWLKKHMDNPFKKWKKKVHKANEANKKEDAKWARKHHLIKSKSSKKNTSKHKTNRNKTKQNTTKKKKGGNNNSSSSSSSNNSGSSNSSDSSSNPSSSSSHSKPKHQKKLNHIQKQLWAQANIYNANVPAGAQATYEKALEYDPDMQVLVTYAILRNKEFYTGTKGYAALYDNGKHDHGNPKELIKEFNDQDIGYKLPEGLGNQKILRDISHYKASDKQMSKSNQVTSAAPDGDNKNTNNSDDNGARSEAKKVAKWLAGKTMDATAISGGSVSGQGNSSYSEIGVTQSSASLRHPINTLKNNGNAGFNDDNAKNFNGTYVGVVDKTVSPTTRSHSGKYYDLLVSAYTEYVNTQIKSNVGKTGSAITKQIKGTNVGAAVAWLRSKYDSDYVGSLRGAKTVSPYGHIRWVGNAYYVPLDAKSKSAAKEQMDFLNICALGTNGLAGLGGSFNSHYNKIMSEKPSNVNLDQNKINNTANNNKKAFNQDQDSVGKDKGIGWNWVSPKSKAWQPRNLKFKKEKSDGFASNADGFLIYAKKGDPVQVSTNALSMTGKGETGKEFHAFNVNLINTKTKYPIYAALDGKAGNANGLIGGPINVASKNAKIADSTNSAIAEDWSNKITPKSFTYGSIGANDKVMGYDTYGNMVEGKTGPYVVIPYWQNWTVKQFKHPRISVGVDGISANSSWDSNLASEVRKFVNQGKSNSNSASGSVVDFASQLSGGDYNGKSGLGAKTAAQLAVAISAQTAPQVKAYNKQMMNISKSNQELYIGESATHRGKHASHSGSGTYLYTATDIIQRAGLATDYGFFDSIRKTIVAGLVNTYNNGFIQSGQQDIFHTTTSSETGMYNNMGLLPFYIATAILGIVYLWVLFNQVILHRYDLKRDSKRYITSLLKVILIGVLVVATPLFDDWFLNKPGEIMINKSLKQESVLDQWSDLRQEQSINNVLYSGLFGETFGQINTSQSYTLKFYTTTYKGSANVQDKQNNLGPNTKAVNDKSATSRDALKNMSDNQKAALKGNGNVGLMAPYQYKTVNIAATDLLSWAAHMDRQLKTAQQQSGQTDANGQQVTGYNNTEMTEKPNGDYAPGQTPLFVWLDKYYQPLGSRGKSRGGKKYGTTIEGVSYGSGDSAYGKRRNPADTSLKSAYRTGLARNQENDNGDKYKGLSKYTEFAVNTKHYASDLDKQYGIDQDSANKANTDIQDNKTADGKTGGSQGQSDGNTDPSTMLTASQLFLRIWETTFSTIGTNQNNPNNNTDNKANQYGESTKGVENYNSLARFAAAMKGMEIDTGDDNNSGSGANANNPANQGNITASQASDMQQGDVGAVGRRDLINELSMTTAQRAANNGGNGEQFSKAASDVIDAFNIPKPTHDWLNLEDDNSPLDVLHPYYGKKQHEVRDGLINKINKKFLNDYVNTYSVVRFETDNTEAGNDTDNNQNTSNENTAGLRSQQSSINDANDSTGNNNQGDEDSFSMAEAHMLALNEFFIINKCAHEKMFPQRFTPSSVSLDSWNRMLLIPIAQMKQRDDNSQYDIWEDKVNPSSIALQDNVAEYIGLRSTIPALFMFIVMNIALIIFGKLLSFFIAVVFPILLIFSLIRAFFKKDNKITNILFGALACKLILGIMKFILIFTYAYMSSAMNNSFVNSNGQMTLPVLQNCTIITLEIVLFFLFLIKVYIPAVGRSVTTFGAVGAGLGAAGLFSALRTNTRATLSHVPGLHHLNVRGGLHGLHNLAKGGRFAAHTIVGAGRAITRFPKGAMISLGAISGHMSNIGHALKNGGTTSANVIRDIRSRSWHDRLSAGKHVLVDHFRSPRGVLAQRLNNLENAYHAGFNRVYKYGTPQDVIDNAPSGTVLQNIKHAGNLELSLRDMPEFNNAQLPAVKRLIENGNVKGVRLVGDKLVFADATPDMLATPEGRQKLVEPLTIAIQKAMDTTTVRMKVTGINPTYGRYNGVDGQLGVGIGKDMDVAPEQFKDFLSDMNVAGWKLADNIARDANGNILSNQRVHFVPKNSNMSADARAKFFNKDLQRIIGNHLASNAVVNAHTLAVNAGTAQNARKIASQIPGAAIVGSQVLVGRKGAKALDSIVNDMNNVTAHDHKMFSNLGNGLVDYGHGGDGHGFQNAKFVATPNGGQITQFKNNNAQAVGRAFRSAHQITGNNQYGNMSMQARAAADRWDKEFAKSNGNNVFKQTQALQSAMHNTNTFSSLNKYQRQLIHNMNNAARNFGMNGFDKLTDKQKAKAINDYNSLVNGLQHSANWNVIQNEISQNSPSQELHAANDAQTRIRSNILGLASDAAPDLRTMGTRELTATLNTLSDLNMTDNNNGVTEFRGTLQDEGAKRIQRFIQRLN